MEGYFPRKIALIRAWLLNLVTLLPAKGPMVGQTALQITTTQGLASAGMAKIDAVVAAKAASKAAVKDYLNWAKPNGSGLAVIKKSVDEYKTNIGYTTAIGEALMVIGSHDPIDPETYKPTGSAVAQASYVLVKFDKKGVDLMSVDFRVKGATEWTHIGNLSVSPYHHTFTMPPVIPPAVALNSVILEYKLVGILHDIEIGLASDIIPVTFTL